jgi:DNA-binding phage protein
MTERRIVTSADWIAAVLARIAERQLTFAQVEHDAQLGEGYLGKLLSGKKMPTLETMAKVQRAVGLELSVVSVL